MSGNYEVFLKTSGRFEVMDMRTNPDLSQYIARTSSSWKRLVNAGQRRYYSADHDMHARAGIYALSYGKGPVVIVNPSKGDYIPPGFDRVSRELGELFGSWDGTRSVDRSRLVPMDGEPLINTGLSSTYTHSFNVYRNSPTTSHIPGWSVYYNNGPSYYCPVSCGENGVRTTQDGYICTVSQMLVKEVIVGMTRIRVRLSFADLQEEDRGRNPSYGKDRAVLLGSTLLTRDGDDWLWEGDALTSDTLLTIECNSLRGLSTVEILHD